MEQNSALFHVTVVSEVNVNPYLNMTVNEQSNVIFDLVIFFLLLGHWMCALCENAAMQTHAPPPQMMFPSKMEEFQGRI